VKFSGIPRMNAMTGWPPGAWMLERCVVALVRQVGIVGDLASRTNLRSVLQWPGYA
jgi:hypothetical protein